MSNQISKILISFLFLLSFNTNAQNSDVAELKDTETLEVEQANAYKDEISMKSASLNNLNNDTFGSALKQAAALRLSKIQAEIRQNNAVGNPAISNRIAGAESLPDNAMPLQNAKQSFDSDEPTLEAIWGMEGEEVAEVNFKGVRVSASMASPVISESHGWFLKEIKPFYVILQKKLNGKVVSSKSISLSWGSNVSDTYKANHRFMETN